MSLRMLVRRLIIPTPVFVVDVSDPMPVTRSPPLGTIQQYGGTTIQSIRENISHGVDHAPRLPGQRLRLAETQQGAKR